MPQGKEVLKALGKQHRVKRLETNLYQNQRKQTSQQHLKKKE
tara:strand:- start:774 stop:899 length:126 start_codon:yes stop_codon:yes gene_type:complete